MTEFQKNQIKRQAINDQLPLKLINYLDYQEHRIKQAFTTKSRFILPKSQQKVFHIDDEFASAFTQLTLDEKVYYYSKQVTILKQLIDFNGAMFDSQSQPPFGQTSIKCKVKGKGLGIQWQQLTITVIYENRSVQIPHKLGIYRADLHDYLVRQTINQQKPQIVFDSTRPNIIKHWRFTFENQHDYQKAFKLFTVISQKALKKKLQDQIRNFQQSKVMFKSTLRKRSQVQIPKSPLLDASKFSSQVFEVNNQNNNSLWLDQSKNKKIVNFQNQNNMKISQPKEETSIIDVLSTQFRAVSPPLDYQRAEPANLFDSEEDWFIKIMSQGCICSQLYNGIEPDVVLNNSSSFKAIYEKNTNIIFQNTKNPRCFKVLTKLKFPKDIVLSAFCQVQKWPMWNKAVEQASVKLRVPASNLLVCKMKMKQLNFKYRPREFLFMMNFFTKNKEWYLMITSVKDSYHPVAQEDVIRAKISRCLIRIKQNNGLTSVEFMIDIKQLGDLNSTQEAQLTQKFLFGLFDLEHCLRDRIFVEARADKYFDLNWNSQKYSRFTLGKNNELDETSSFTSNLCSEICSFYSAEGPEDYGDLSQFKDLTAVIAGPEQTQYSFKKQKQPQSNLGSAPPQQSKINKPKLPFQIPIQNNRVVLDQSTKQKIQKYIRQKQSNRLRKMEDNNYSEASDSLKNYQQAPRAPSKLELNSVERIGPYRPVQQRKSEQRLSSYVEMKEAKDSSKIIKQAPPTPIRQSIVNVRKSSYSNMKSSVVAQSQAGKGQDYDILLSRKSVSKIQIDKHNPDDHIIPYWQPKTYPDTGLVILSDEYIEKWVSIYPINVKKLRPYKGDNWDHFLFRDLWTVTQGGELKCVNQQKLDVQSTAIKLVLKRFASNVMSGKGILNVSLPVQIFSELQF